MVWGDTVSTLEMFVWILNHVSRSITWSLFTLKASYLVKWLLSTWSFMWWCQFIDWLKFETRPNSLRNFGMAYTHSPKGSCAYRENTSDSWDISHYTTRKKKKKGLISAGFVIASIFASLNWDPERDYFRLRWFSGSVSFLVEYYAMWRMLVVINSNAIPFKLRVVPLTHALGFNQ